MLKKNLCQLTYAFFCLLFLSTSSLQSATESMSSSQKLALTTSSGVDRGLSDSVNTSKKDRDKQVFSVFLNGYLRKDRQEELISLIPKDISGLVYKFNDPFRYFELFKTLTGHEGIVEDILYDASSKRLFSAGADQAIKVWNPETGKLLYTLGGHTGKIVQLIYGANQRLFSASQDSTIKAWDLQTGKELYTCEGHTGAISQLCYDDANERLFSGSDDCTVKTWHTAKGEEFWSLTEHASRISCLLYDASSDTLFSGGQYTITVAKPTHKQVLCKFEDHYGFITELVYDNVHKRLFSGSKDGTIKAWNLEKKEELYEVAYRSHLLYDASSQKLFSVIWDKEKNIKEWDIETGAELHTFEGHTNHVQKLVYDSVSKRIFSGDLDGNIIAWHIEKEKPLHLLKGHTSYLSDLAYDASSHMLFSASRDQTIRVWDIQTGEALHTLEAHTDMITKLVYDADNHRLFSSSHDKTICIWQFAAFGFYKTVS